MSPSRASRGGSHHRLPSAGVSTGRYRIRSRGESDGRPKCFLKRQDEEAREGDIPPPGALSTRPSERLIRVQ